jgi:hypothetical protein
MLDSIEKEATMTDQIGLFEAIHTMRAMRRLKPDRCRMS